jgi:Saccharopine dehydrogenase NADP binding domain
MKILILGGYGLTGTHLSRLLLAHTNANIVIAGRSLQKAESLAANLGRSFPLDRVRAACVDVAEIDSVRSALAGVDLVLLATSFARHCSVVAKAAVEMNVGYLDVLYAPEKLEILNALAPQIERLGLCFVTEAGFHPGLPLALVRYMACRFDNLDEAIVSSVIQMKIDPGMEMPESIYDLVAAFRQKPVIFRDGRWFTPWLSWIWPYRRIRFASPFGTRSCVPFFMPELRHIPNEFAQIRETGFYIAGFNWFVDWFLSPLILLAVLIAPKATTRPMAKLLFWGAKHFTRPPYGTQLVVDAVGRREREPSKERLVLSHEDAYVFTAIPVVAFLKQYLEGTVRKPGVWMMGQLADPMRLVEDMERIGITVHREASDQH